MPTITANGEFQGRELKDMPVLNPGDWFGKTWLIELGGCAFPAYLVVEADSVDDAIDEMAEHEKYGHQIVVEEADLGDYPEEDRHYSGSGQVLDLDNINIYGEERVKQPFLCTYHGPGLPAEGINPTDYCDLEGTDDDDDI